MTFEELLDVYYKAEAKGTDRDAVAAVVRALRDEMFCNRPLRSASVGHHCQEVFNEILSSDAGEKVAEGDFTNPSEGRVIAPATDPCPDCGGRKYLAKHALNGTYYVHCYCPKLKATDPVPNKTALHWEAACRAVASLPDAAPADVCVWTLTNWTPDTSWYERKCDGETYERDLRHLACPSCGKTIKFTEAK